MKIAVISDTHIPQACEKLPDSLLKELAKTDLIIHAGDLAGLSVLENLKKIAPVEAVIGNMDSHNMRKELPEKKILEIEGFRIGIIHGEGPPDRIQDYVKMKFAGEKLDCIIHGHSHTPYIEKIDNTIYFNPGSPTDKVFAPYNSYGILEITDKITPKIVRL
ncbi:MAG: metallophosphoesterase family protein [Candidatus Omnitrophica bacterium]|nr:metallophosphoesterase family protein [Candidatus Omnitrophota bacterium]